MALYHSLEYQTSMTFQFRRSFQYDGCGGHLGFLVRTILAILIYKLLHYLQHVSRKIRHNSGTTMEKRNKKAKRWPRIAHLGTRQVWPFSSVAIQNAFLTRRLWLPSWISDRNNFSCFDLQVTPILPNKFPVSSHFGSGEEV